MHIAPVVTRTDLEGFHAVEAAAMAHDHVGLPAEPLEEWLPFLDEPEIAGERVQLYVGREDGQPVGALTMRIPTLDNLAVVNAEVRVHPDHRRQGHGRQLVDRLIAETQGLGRTRIFNAVASFPDRPPLAQRLLDDLGAKPVIEDVRRVLDLHEGPLPRCEVPQGYRVVQWKDRAPNELVEGCAYLMSRMTLDAPMGDMDYEQEKWDAARYRDMERAARDRHRLHVTTAAVHTSGQVAGITDVAVNLTAPEVASQWETIVDPDHRGHGLGLVLKTWNHALLAETAPAVRYLNTWNAASNTFMIRVNDALGFRPVETWTEYQLDL
ncbi:MAG: GNAT family N-acetyltransferase [Mycobacteriales bacterium]